MYTMSNMEKGENYTGMDGLIEGGGVQLPCFYLFK